MNILVFNPGSNSLKAGIVRCDPSEHTAAEATKLVEVIVEGIGREPKLSLYQGKKIASSEPIDAQDFEEAAANAIRWLERHARSCESDWAIKDVERICVRVVHGGSRFTRPVRMEGDVEREIAGLARWAPLHNPRSIEILAAIRRRFPDIPIYAVFDTAFHCGIPDRAALYAIPFELTKRHGIRRYGFHGISHRYLMERYAAIVGRLPGELDLITMHLESGCSITAISQGRSVDNTMGLTPLEGLMMGMRCGDIDPSLPAFLAKEEHLDLDKVMEILEKKSGLLGVSGKSLDTRVLMRDYDSDERVRIAMEMFSYRLLKAVGSYLGVLGGAHAIIFGGGLGENTSFVRQRVCEGLRWCGLEMDEEQNRSLIDVEGRLSIEQSPLQAYVIPVEETLQIAHECAIEMKEEEVLYSDTLFSTP